MSDELREKVARAICCAENEDKDPHIMVPDSLMPETWASDNNKRDYRRMADAALSVVAEHGVKVKALQWLDVHGDRSKLAAALYEFPICRTSEGQWFWNGQYFRYLDDAKSAAQTDFEKRTLSALEPAPMSVAEAARVLLGAMPNYAMERAAIESRATDDEGEFPPLLDLLDFSGQNKTHTVVREALSAAIRAAMNVEDADE